MRIVLFLFVSIGLMAEGLDKEKNWGVELNPVSLFGAGELVSGTLSYFYHDKAAEIAIPIFYVKDNEDKVTDNSQFNIDIHYRQYTSQKLEGFYWSGFGRFTHIDGKTKEEESRLRQGKVGLGIGLGYRKFNLLGYKELYWGAGAILGGYVSGENEIFEEIDDEGILMGDLPFILDVEFFKIGYAF